MLFPTRFTLQDSYRIISYGICFYESNACIGNTPIESQSYTNPMQIL
jgi:hypothetical protein